MMINGPAGALESVLQQAAQTRGECVAILCHPHPQYGGSMHDAVIDAAAAGLQTLAIDALRFNFRGVGASAGSFDDGVGEIADAVAVVAHARGELGYSRLMLVGYSFGSRVCWMASKAATPEQLVLIAPPIGMMEYPVDAAPTCPISVVVGSDDSFVEHTALAEWRDQHSAQLETIRGADHFFGGRWDEVSSAVARLSGQQQLD